MLISVIVPFRNESAYIRSCVTALANQTIKKDRYELFFVDNGSTDRSAEIVKTTDPQAHVLEEKAGGQYAARNAGLGLAKGEWIAFTDGDCAVANDWLERIIDHASKSKADIILGPSRFAGRGGFLEYLENYENLKLEYVCKRRSPAIFGHANNMAIRSEVFRRAGLFGETRFAEDTTFIHRAYERYPGLKVSFCDTMVITHLEIKTWRDWARKILLYAKTSTLAHYRNTHHRTLTWHERLEIAHQLKKQFPITKRRSFQYFVGLCLLGILFDLKKIIESIKCLIARTNPV